MKHILVCTLSILIELCCHQNSNNIKGSRISNLSYTNNTDINIVGSIWQNDFNGEECRDVLYFQNNQKFNHFENCELLDSTYGSWNLLNNDLTLIEEGSYLDINNSKDSIPKIKWEAVINNDTLILTNAYDWNYLENCFYLKPDRLDKTLNMFIRIH